MAEGLAAAILGADHEIQSAGIAAQNGAPWSRLAMESLREQDINHHGIARPLTRELFAWADLVLCMTHGHETAVKSSFGENAKVMTLGAWAGEPDCEIDDPYGGDLKEYRAVRDTLRRLIQISDEFLRG